MYLRIVLKLIFTINYDLLGERETIYCEISGKIFGIFKKFSTVILDSYTHDNSNNSLLLFEYTITI